MVVRLKPGEPELQRGAPDGQLASIDLPAYAAQLGYPVLTGAYGQLASETPAAATMPFPFPKPSVEEGTHLSYSLQWFAFGVLMFIGFGYAARQQARNAAIDAQDAGRGRGARIRQWPRTAVARRPASGRTRRRRKRKTRSWTPRGTDAMEFRHIPEPVANVQARPDRMLGADDTVTRVRLKVPTAAAAAAALGCDVAAITNSLVFDVDGAPLLILASGAAKVDIALVAASWASGRSAAPPRPSSWQHTGQEVAAWPR